MPPWPPAPPPHRTVPAAPRRPDPPPPPPETTITVTIVAEADLVHVPDMSKISTSIGRSVDPASVIAPFVSTEKAGVWPSTPYVSCPYEFGFLLVSSRTPTDDPPKPILR